MKAFKIALLASIISAPLSAAEIDKSWEIGVFGDYIKSSTAKESATDWQQIEAGKSLGLDIQKYITEQFSIRFELAQTFYEIEDGNDTDTGNRFGLDMMYNLKDSGLYGFIGARRFNNAQDYTALNIGAGYSYQMTERFSAYAEAVLYKDLSSELLDQGLKLGVKYAFGDVKKSPVTNNVTDQAVVEEPVVEQKVAEQPVVEKAVTEPEVAQAAVIAAVVILDSDNDGVSDENDNCADTATTVKVGTDGCILYSGESVEVELNVSFASSSSVVQPASMTDIEHLANFMKKHPETSATIEGHSSALGDAKFNLSISQKRADAVKTILVNDFNIGAARVSAQGFGENQLLSKGNTTADHKLNRRVVAKIETITKKAVQKD
jgi:OOP family OmpA-OmpF porin